MQSLNESDDTLLPSPTPLVARMVYGLAALNMLILVAALLLGNYQHVLRHIGVPTLQLPFADVRTITGGAMSAREGLDPMVDNPEDPWRRPMNYPRVWQQLFHWPLTHADAPLLAAVFIGFFFLGNALLLPLYDSLRTALWGALALASPAVWLALERGNNDMLIFGLLAAVPLLAVRLPWVGAGLISMAGLLKLFPVFALASLWPSSPRKTVYAAIAATLLLLGAYGLWSADDLRRIAHGTPEQHSLSYGIGVLPGAIAKQIGAPGLKRVLELAGLAIFLFSVAFA